MVLKQKIIINNKKQKEESVTMFELKGNPIKIGKNYFTANPPKGKVYEFI